MPLRIAASLLIALATLTWGVEFRAASYNIGAHLVIPPGGGPTYFDYGIGPPGQPDHEKVREVLDRIDADVVALQEIHGADFNAGHLTALSNSLGYPHVFYAPSTNTFDTSLHVAFLSRFPFLSQTLINSPAGAKEMNRLIPVVKIDVPGTTRDPVLIGAHLKSGGEASDLFQRTVEMRRLTNYLTTLGLTNTDDFLIMGDLNLSDGDRTFSTTPGSGLPGSFVLGPDIIFPINYYTTPTAYFGNPTVTRIIPRQVDNSTVTFPSSGSTIDLFLTSPTIGARPLHTEIYNSALDTSNTVGLPKSGSPLAAGTSAAASDHLAIFGDFELDPAVPYTFTAPGQTVSETFADFAGTYDPYPWVISGGSWNGTDNGGSKRQGFRSYGSASDPSLGFIPGTSTGSATASFVNQSTKTLSALQISFTAEQWRSAFGGGVDTLSAELIVGGVPHPLPQLTYQAPTNLPNGPITGGTSIPKNMTVTGLAIAPGTTFQLKFTFTHEASGGPPPADVFINEFSYVGTGEFIEVVVGPGFTGSLSNITVLLYNGAGGPTYGSAHALTSFAVGAVTPSGHRIYSKSITSIQNGDPDGFALVVGGTVTRFISYGGSFSATAGSANGLTSTDILVKQSGSDGAGFSSLGLTGTGGAADNFDWIRFDSLPISPGQPNAGQTFAAPPQGIAIDNLAVTFLSDSDGDGFSDADEAVFGTDPLDAGSRFVMTFANPSPVAGSVRLAFPAATGRSYTVESSANLSSWRNEGTYPGTGAGIVADIAIDPQEAKRFYRIRAATD
ncbi:MAG: endonuclease/exonuclease/phosphatase family protein [Verrucomicrobiota bacterium]